jgi:hypothetical protein
MKAILTIDATDPLDLVDRLREQKAAQTAADRTAKRVRTEMTKRVRGQLGLPAKRVRDRIVLRRATIKPVQVMFDVDARPIPLGEFKATQLKRAGTRVKIGGRTMTFRGAFKATFKSRLQVARRLGSERIPTRPLYGPSMANGFEDEWQAGLAVFRAHFDEELFRALRFGRGRRR